MLVDNSGRSSKAFHGKRLKPLPNKELGRALHERQMTVVHKTINKNLSGQFFTPSQSQTEIIYKVQ